MKQGLRPSTYLLALVPVVLWGSSFAVAKVALRSMSPIGLVTCRAILGLGVFAAILPFLRQAGSGDVRRGDRWRIVLLAVLGVVVQMTLQAQALTMTSAIHSGWLITLIPVFTAILSVLVLGESFPAMKTAGTALGLLGALVVIAGGHGLDALSLPSGKGDLLILGSALNWAVYTLFARSLLSRRRAFPVTFQALAIGTAALVVLWLGSGRWDEVVSLPAEGLAALLFLGIGCTGISYLCWSTALERLEPGTLTSFQFLQPLVGSVVAAWGLGEEVSAWVLLGAILVTFGVFLVQRAVARPPARVV